MKTRKFEKSEGAQKEKAPQRGRPRSREKNQNILQSAAALFLELGFDATNVDDVARRAGVSKQTVYSHFENKEILFKCAVSALWTEVFGPELMEPLALDDMEEALLQTGLVFGRALLSKKSLGLYRILVSISATKPELSREFWKMEPTYIFDAIHQRFTEWQAAGLIECADLAEATFDFSLLIRGSLHYQLALGLVNDASREESDAQIRRGVQKFLRIYAVNRGKDFGHTGSDSTK